MSKPFQVHVVLKEHPADLAELEEYARNPARTIDECWDWLQARGYVVSRTAVFRWKSSFDLTDRFRAANALAQDLMGSVAQEKGTVAISDAAMVKLSEMLFTQMLRMQETAGGPEGGPGVSTKELWALSMALKNVVQGKRHVEKLKGEMAEALAAAEKDARNGASGEAVVTKVREILGIRS